ncbi:MAG: pentapeptide repeat-containing protein [Cyanothece sp. SIO1E1]|nr:pentapeptide repeat-containing protein [Cyanothece sp. SIO1E1]
MRNKLQQEHLDLLDLGVKVWNEKRSSDPSLRPALRGVDLSEKNLSGVDLVGANMKGARFLRG